MISDKLLAGIERIFNDLDKDKSGHVSVNELINSTSGTCGDTQTHLLKLYFKADESNDKKISKDEFLKFFSDQANFLG
ncbi:hypothetical protein SNEBB_007737 [Seison nebaliae]|nr:hypothetical protein SNEBB_007737 [Seison nebaliae]